MIPRTAIAITRIESSKRFAAAAMVGALSLAACGADSAPDTFEARPDNRTALAAEADRYVELQQTRAAEATAASEVRPANQAALAAEADRYVELQKNRAPEATAAAETRPANQAALAAVVLEAGWLAAGTGSPAEAQTQPPCPTTNVP